MLAFVNFMDRRSRLALIFIGAAALLLLLLGMSFFRTPYPTAKADAEMGVGSFQIEAQWGTAGNTTINTPVSIEFAGGKIYIGEKGGRIKEFDSWNDTSATTVLDISAAVMNGYDSGVGSAADDRGMLSFTMHPNYPATKFVYVIYTTNYDPFNGTVWGDKCPSYTNGCPVFSRVSRFDLSSPNPTTTETIFLQDFCQVFSSHSVGKVVFGPDGALYVSHGEGADPDPSKVDYGQLGTPKNACGDPPSARGVTPPSFLTANGGSFRAQGLERSTGVTVSMSGSIVRMNPMTGAPMADNPLISHPMTRAQYIIANGMRNPFRYAFRPGTSELWIGDVGAGKYEEINRIVSPTQKVLNFGWPCFEGNEHQEYFKSLGGVVNQICTRLYANEAVSVTMPYYTYTHGVPVIPNDGCVLNLQDGSSVSGLTFYPLGGSFPSTYTNALFIGDYARQCVWVMPPGANGLPDPTKTSLFMRKKAGGSDFGPTDLKVGPDGYLYVVDVISSEILRVKYVPPGNDGPPVAAIRVSPRDTGGAPYTVLFSGDNSYTPDPGRQIVKYEWDFTSNGSYDALGRDVNFTYDNPGVFTATLRVTDDLNRTDTEVKKITVYPAPNVTITLPTADYRWAVDDLIYYEASAMDFVTQTVTMTTRSYQQHCPTAGGCHSHFGPSNNIVGKAISGTILAGDHEFPTYWVLEVTAVNDFGGSKTVTKAIYPKVVTGTLLTDPPGGTVNFGLSLNLSTPVTQGAIVSSSVGVSAPPTRTVNSALHCFQNWSDGGPNAHLFVIPQTDFTLTAVYTTQNVVNSLTDSFDSNNPCDITLRRAIQAGYTNISFAPGLANNGSLTLNSPLTLPSGVTLQAADCAHRVKITTTPGNDFILAGNNTVSGLIVEDLTGPALKLEPGKTGNKFTCSTFRTVVASPGPLGLFWYSPAA